VIIRQVVLTGLTVFVASFGFRIPNMCFFQTLLTSRDVTLLTTAVRLKSLISLWERMVMGCSGLVHGLTTWTEIQTSLQAQKIKDQGHKITQSFRSKSHKTWSLVVTSIQDVARIFFMDSTCCVLPMSVGQMTGNRNVSYFLAAQGKTTNKRV